MYPITIKPSPRLRSKYRLIAWLTLVSQLVWSVPLGLAIGWEAAELTGGMAGILIALALNALWFLPTLWLVDRYYESLSYELQEDEIIVRIGIWTATVKHVPFRTVTNIAIKRDIFDRFLFNIGTVEIQTAGSNNTQQSAEETLAGLVDYEGVYLNVAEALRRYRTLPLGPTQAAPDALPSPAGPAPDLSALLAEVRAIRALLAERKAE